MMTFGKYNVLHSNVGSTIYTCISYIEIFVCAWTLLSNYKYSHKMIYTTYITYPEDKTSIITIRTYI